MNSFTIRDDRPLFILGLRFVLDTLLAEFIGIKIFSLVATLGIAPIGYQLNGKQMSLSFKAGIILRPDEYVIGTTYVTSR